PSPAPAKPRKPRTVKPAHGTARLYLGIVASGTQTLYTAKPVPVDPDSGVARMVRLAKVDGSARYHVARLADGSIDCDCPSYEFDHRQRDNGPCKHGAACLASGLL